MTEPLGNVFCKGCVILGSGCLRCGRCAVGLAKKQESAVATLKRLGYTDCGGELWKPPIGNAPDFNLLDAANAQIAELQSQLSAIGAGGVERLRKRDDAEDEGDAADEWRRLALQFDEHRMLALWHLRRLVRTDDGYPEAKEAEQFLASPPLPGEAVLAQRIAALAVAPAQAVAVPSDHQCKLLAEALGECIMAAGIVRKDIDGLSGPQLLMFAEDLKRHLAAPAQEDAALQQYEAFFDQVFAQACSNGLFDAWGKRVDCTRLNEAHQLACDAKKGGAA